MKDTFNNILAVSGALPVVITSSDVTTGDVDLQGYNSALLLVHVGAIVDALDASNKIALKLEHADDDGTGIADSYTDVTDDDVLSNLEAISSGIFKTLDADTDDSKLYAIGYTGGKRFIKLTAVPTSIGTGGPIGITVLKGHPAQLPVTQNA